jgi:hypothetical protein
MNQFYQCRGTAEEWDSHFLPQHRSTCVNDFDILENLRLEPNTGVGRGITPFCVEVRRGTGVECPSFRS